MNDSDQFPGLYPESLQDQVNKHYTHDKVLPKTEMDMEKECYGESK